jgi:hypothetical protein
MGYWGASEDSPRQGLDEHRIDSRLRHAKGRSYIVFFRVISACAPRRQSTALCCCLLAALLATGCNGSGLNLAPVEGIVTLDGQPVADAGVLFVPSDPKQGPPAMGVTDATGAFSLRTVNDDGAVVGDYRVSISKSEQSLQPVAGSRALRHIVKRHVPEKYEAVESSGLTATVAEDENHFEFPLISN